MGAIVDMRFFARQLLNENSQAVKVVNSPGTKETFVVDEMAFYMKRNAKCFTHLRRR
jgi:hypothetical protein